MNGQKAHLTGSVSECCLILAITLGLPILNSLWAMTHFNETTTYRFTEASLVNMMIIEFLSLSAAGFILHLKGWRHQDLEIRFSFKQCGAGLLLFIASYAMYAILYHATTNLFGMQPGWGNFPVRSQYSVGVAVAFSALNAFFEESVTVGYLLNSMRRHGPLFAISFSMFVRFLYHTYQGPIAVVSIMPLGILFGAVYWRYRTLGPLVFAHFLIDVYALLLLKYLS